MEKIYSNIRDFGAVGDGVTDDTEALEKAMAAAVCETGTVFIPAGQYRIRPVRVPSGITLLALPAWGYNYGVRPAPYIQDLLHTGHTWFTPQNRSAEALFDLSDTVGTRLVGISIDGALLSERRQEAKPGEIDSARAYEWKDTPPFAGIVARNAAGLTFEDVRVVTTPGDCIRLENVKGFAVRRALLTRSRGAAVKAVNCTDGIVIDTQLSFNQGDGFLGENSENLRILSNRIEGGYLAAVRFEHCRNATINGNSIDFPRGMGTMLRDSESVTVMGNMYRCSGRDQRGELNTHAGVYRCRGCTVIANTMWSYAPLRGDQMTENGMILEDLTDCTVTENALYDSCDSRTIIERGSHIGTVIRENPGVPVTEDTPELGWTQTDFREDGGRRKPKTDS